MEFQPSFSQFVHLFPILDKNQSSFPTISTKINLKKLISTEMPGLMTGFLKMRTAVIFKVIKADGSKKIGNLDLTTNHHWFFGHLRTKDLIQNPFLGKIPVRTIKIYGELALAYVNKCFCLLDSSQVILSQTL